MILEALKVMFVLLTALMMVYLVRHYAFTLTVLKKAKNPKEGDTTANAEFKPIVSILIPAHNEENVIGRVLQRMTELTYPKEKLQVIVINDGSSDNTGRIADEYSSRYRFIEVLHRDKRDGGKGKAAAMNAGFEHSTGEIILCFDADYYPQKDIVEKLVKEFADSNVGAVQGSRRFKRTSKRGDTVGGVRENRRIPRRPRSTR